MAQQITFDYFRGMEAEQYTFYKIPKTLFTSECFKLLSCEAKVLYGLMLDRMSLSIKNRWFDEQERVYIIFTVDEIMELLGCGRQKAIKNIRELDTETGIGLIEKKRLGLGKPNVIYVKNFMIRESVQSDMQQKELENAVNAQKYENQTSGSTKIELQEVRKSNFKKYENQTSGSMKIELQEVPESNFKKYENQTSGSMKIKLQEVPESYSNNTDINNTDINETNPIYPIPSSGNEIDWMDEIRNEVRARIEYPILTHDNPYDIKTIDELVELIVEILIQPDPAQIRIGGVLLPAVRVKDRFRKLEYGHIQYIMYCLQNNRSRVANIKAYLLTTLYNAPATQYNYFRAAVNADQVLGKEKQE